MSLQFNFEGKVVLITGSSAGIGAATALLFSKSGANVVINGRNTKSVSDVAKQCRQISPNNSRVLEVVADVTKEEDLKRLVDETIKAFGKLDILVNNAGFGQRTTITDSDYMEIFNRIMETNLTSVVSLTHLCVEHLAKTKGNIINVSSISSHRNGKTFSPYNVSKAALDMFTKCMAAELGSKGIRVNSINPGVTKSNFGFAMGLERPEIEAYWHSFASKLPLGRVGEGVDIANAILFLASNEATFITGSILVSDGGNLAANVPFD